MALQVWLPLNGNLDNQGISDATFSIINNNTAANTAGKIGKCYYTTSFTAGGLLSDKVIKLGQKQSMFCWFKIISLNSSSSLGGGLVSQHRYPSNCGMGITIKYVSTTTGYLSVNTGNGSSRTYNTYCGTTLLQAGTWYHGGYTYDGSELKIYVNGICEKTVNITGMSTPDDYLTVFCWSFSGTSGSSVYGGYIFNGFINDVRVYDHCLTLKEVKEISKGLVVHYQLKDTTIEATTNLCTNLVAGGRTTLSADKMSVTTNGTEGDTYFDMALSETLVSGTTYTLSMYATGMPEGKEWIMRIGNLSQYLFSIYNGYNKITFVADNSLVTSVNNRGTKLLIDDGGGAARYAVTTFSHCQLEKKAYASPYTIGTRSANNIIYDCSGFKYNGTIAGSLTNSTNTARYSISTFFNQSGHIINSDFNVTMTAFTMNFWINTKAMTTSQHFLFGTFTSWTSHGIGIWRDSGAPTKFNCLVKSDSASSYANNPIYLTLDAWNMITMVYNGTSVTGYLNGTQYYTVSYGSNGTITNPNLMLGNSKYNSTAASENEEAIISDFRLYATALSVDDIKDLYQSAAHVDKNNFYAYEFVEG